MDGQLTAGRIVETEAYRGPDDKACHAWNNRRTPRTEVMYQAGGVAYIYLCYGIHHLMNVVTGPSGQPHAVLIRALEPVAGLDIMASRRHLAADHPRLTTGPGALSMALGLHSVLSGTSLVAPESPVWLEEGPGLPDDEVCKGPRIGVESAGDAAAWPWRFFVRGNKFVSARRSCS